MKKTGLFKVIMFILLGMTLITWIFSASAFEDGSLTEYGMLNVGFFDFFSLIIRSFSFTYFVQIFIFLVAVGALYGVLEKTGKYRAWIEKIAKNLKGREFYFLIAVSLLITLMTSVFNYGICSFIFFPLIISIVLELGYDKVTACLTTFGALLVGIIGSTIGYNATGVIAEVISTKVETAMYYKLALLGFSYAALLFFLSRAKHSTKKEEDLFMGEKIANKYSTLPIIIVLLLVFVLLVLGCTKWGIINNAPLLVILISLIAIFTVVSIVVLNNKSVSYIIALVFEALLLLTAYLFLSTKFNNKVVLIVILALLFVVSVLLTIFVEKFKKIPVFVIVLFVFGMLLFLCMNYAEKINAFNFTTLHNNITNYSIKLPYAHVTNDGIDSGKQKVDIFGKIIGQGNAFGSWQYAEMAIVCFFASLILGWLYKVEGIFSSMANGAKKMIKPGLMVLLAYSVVYFAGNEMFYPTIANLLLHVTKKFSVFFGSITTILGSLFHVDMLYVANYVAPQVLNAGASSTLTVLLVQGLYGVTMFIAPTSCILVLGLTYLEIPYKEWIKKTWLLVLELLVVVEAILILVRYL